MEHGEKRCTAMENAIPTDIEGPFPLAPVLGHYTSTYTDTCVVKQQIYMVSFMLCRDLRSKPDLLILI